MNAQHKPTNRQIVLQAVVDLHASGRVPTRQSIASATGLRMSVVDDHVKMLKADELIRAVVNGVFEPVDMRADRPVSGTIIDGNLYKLEVGDIVLDLTLREARNIGLLTGGLGMQFGR